MSEKDKERERKFKDDLKALYLKHELYIDFCCCAVVKEIDYDMDIIMDGIYLEDNG